MVSQEDKENAIKSARIALNFGVFVLLFCVLWLLQDGMFPNLFDPKAEVVEVDSSAVYVEPERITYVELDSADIVNGIHQPTGLIVDDGCQEVMVTCGACHSLDLVTQNRATRDGWKEIIVWMQETQKLWDLGEQEDIILTYLAKNYAPENSGRRKNIEVEEWYVLH